MLKKAPRTAFLVAPLARVDGECMVLDGPALIFTCCHSALAARAATGALTVTAVTFDFARRAQLYLRVPFRATGLELDRSEVILTLLTLCLDLSNSNPVPRKGTHKYVRSARVASHLVVGVRRIPRVLENDFS